MMVITMKCISNINKTLLSFNDGIDSRVAKRILTTPFKLVLLNS
ncbi:hypothetical protein [Holdemanella sp.]|nr:hypothetical protein [Holdemanella sp.]